MLQSVEVQSLSEGVSTVKVSCDDLSDTLAAVSSKVNLAEFTSSVVDDALTAGLVSFV